MTHTQGEILPAAVPTDSQYPDALGATRSPLPLRVGILTCSSTLPRWGQSLLSDIKKSSFAELALVIQARQADSSRAANQNLSLAFRAYRWLDDHLFQVSPDAFEQANVEPLVAQCSRIQIDFVHQPENEHFSDEDVDKILEFNLDVVISLDAPKLRGRALDIAKHGVWNLGHAEEGPAGFWEVIKGQSTTASLLRILSDNGQGEKVIYRSHAMTDLRSMKINRSNLYWKSYRIVCRKLKELHERGPEALQSVSSGSNEALPAPDSHGVPSNGKMCSLMWSFGRRFLAAKTNRLLRWDQWILGFQTGGEFEPSSPNLSRLQTIVPPRDRFWADPYPIKKNGKYFIFLEELIYRNGKGHLAVMEMDPDGSYQAPVVILEKDYHLSNPSVFEFQGQYYMVPESSQNKTLEMYRCLEFPYRWELHKVLMRNVTAADASIVEHAGRWWMFANLAEGEIADNYDELFLFYADTPLGPWHEHPGNPIKSDVRSARPAGRLIRRNGNWFRPAQDCSRRYGHAIVINKVIRWNRREYQEIEISKILPQWGKNLVGTHTLNHCEGLTVVDGLFRRPRVF